MKYVVTFDRVGRDSFVPPQTFEVEDGPESPADYLASKIFHFAKSKLASKWFEVTVDLEKMKGSIEYGRFGSFTIKEAS